MSQSIKDLRKQLGDALDTIEQSTKVDSSSVAFPSSIERGISFKDDRSLVSLCDDVCFQYPNAKPKLRIVHHLACSGGTLISKCLSAMPNVFVLSEVHPNSEFVKDKKKAQFSPSDVSKLAMYANVSQYEILASKIFVKSILESYEHITSRGGILVLRDHTHSDFCSKNFGMSPPAVYTLLKDIFEIINIVTIRNPIDTYLSLVKNNWKHFEPFTFDEYCKRFLNMIDFYSDCEIYRYEDFVKDPTQIMTEICKSLSVPYSNYFEEIFDLFNMTGDSGRSSSVITERPRVELSKEFRKEIDMSQYFKKINEYFDYGAVE